jgi:hypothetical protein
MPHKLLAVALCLCAGCSIYSNAAHNLFREPCDYLQGRILSHALRKQAQDAWRAFAAEHPEWCHGDDFEAGFVDGFADYLDNGGKGAPPAIPPKRYRKNKYLNPGRRDTLVVPVLVPIPADPPPRPDVPPMPELPAPRPITQR